MLRSTHPHNVLAVDCYECECGGCFMEVDWSHVSVVGGGVMFGEVISKIAFTFAPINLELILSHSVSHPIEAHVNGF